MEMHHSSLCLVRSRFSCASVRESNYMFVDLSGSVLKQWRGSGQSDRVYRWLLLVHRKLELWWCRVYGIWTYQWPVMRWPREVRKSVFIAMEAEAHRIVMDGPVGIALRASMRAEARKEMEERRRMADFKLKLESKSRKLKIDKDGKIVLVFGEPGPIIDGRLESTQPTNAESTATSSTDNRVASIDHHGAAAESSTTTSLH